MMSINIFEAFLKSVGLDFFHLANVLRASFVYSISYIKDFQKIVAFLLESYI